MPAIAKSKYMITSYAENFALFRTGVHKFWFAVLMLLLAVIPLATGVFGDQYLLSVLNLAIIGVIVALGLNLLTGSTGLVSFGHAAFVAVGSYTAGLLTMKLGVPFWLCIPLAGVFTAAFGVIVGLPALRMKGVYLALATLAAQFIVQHLIVDWEGLTGGTNGLRVTQPTIGSLVIDTETEFYFLAAGLAVLLTFGIANIMRSRIGRALLAVRDSDIAAQAMGVSLARYKTLSFGISAGYAGIAGSLHAYHAGYIGPDFFTITLSVEYIVMILIGGLGSIRGSIMGALFVTFLHEGISLLEGAFSAILPGFAFPPDLESLFLGLALILFIIFEPQGLAGLWDKIRRYWNTWPF
ncbi:MAG: branched-chain amino acid ABC transporter permease [Promethearchaeota archaeon]